MIFRGTFEHALDAKHRLTVPAKFRAALADGVVLAASPEVSDGSPRSVSVWTPDGYEAFIAGVLHGLHPASREARELKRFYFSQSHDTELDSANRVMLPPFLRAYAHLGREVVITGAGECLEIFDRPAFEGYREDVLVRIPDIAASLGDTA